MEWGREKNKQQNLLIFVIISLAGETETGSCHFFAVLTKRLSVSQQHLPGRRLRVRGLRSPAAQRRRRRQRRGLLGARQPFIRSLRNHHTHTHKHTHTYTHTPTLHVTFPGGGDGWGHVWTEVVFFLSCFSHSSRRRRHFFAAVFSICLLCFSFSWRLKNCNM